MRVAAALLLLTVAALPAFCRQSFTDFTTPLPLPEGSTLIIGFLGGFEHWDDPHRGVRKTALRLREMHLPGVFAETVENHRRSLATDLIHRALGSNSGVRIILYGQSLGGWAVVKLAREFNREGIPVLLTVQVDSVGIDDSVIPPNVKAAANLFQRDFLPVHGTPAIRATDAARTEILGNFQYHYKPGFALSPDQSAARMIFMGAHNKMEIDPAVWAQVQQLILDALNKTSTG
jgi:pimeloyl-ACP methyl ester carboxylesterase